MKKIKLILFALILFAGSGYGQAKAAIWPEQKAFHALIAATFHPSEDGDLKPVKEKADSLYSSAKAWQTSSIPDDYKPEETAAALKLLVAQCAELTKYVKSNASDKVLKTHITAVHETFHKIAGECRKTDEPGH